MTEVHGFICSSKLYSFEGVAIEFPAMSGPCPLTKQGDPKQRWSKREHEVINRFLDLSDNDKEKYRIGGGCFEF